MKLVSMIVGSFFLASAALAAPTGGAEVAKGSQMVASADKKADKKAEKGAAKAGEHNCGCKDHANCADCHKADSKCGCKEKGENCKCDAHHGKSGKHAKNCNCGDHGKDGHTHAEGDHAGHSH